MKALELIALLHRSVEDHGDLDVRAYDYSAFAPTVAETLEIETNQRGETYILVRP